MDNTAHLLQYEGSGGTVIGTMVQPTSARTANQFVTYINSAGVPQTAALAAADVPGLAAQYIDWNASSGGASIANKPTIPTASSTNPSMDGTASAGASANYSRYDHVHPSDTSREPALGNPATNGYVLSSTTAGVRSWVAQSGGSMLYPGAGVPNSTGGAWGASFTIASTVATANAIVQRDGSGNVVATNAVAIGKTPLATDGNGGSLTGLTASQVGLGSVTNDAQTKASVMPNTAPSAGQVPCGNAGGTAYAPCTIGTDATLSSAGALTLAAKHKTRTQSMTIMDPVATDSGRAQFSVPYASTITKVACSVKAATSVSINIDKRAWATPDTAGTSALSASLVCDTNGQNSCGSGCDVNTIASAAMAADIPVALVITAVTGTPDTLRVYVTYTVD